MPDLDARLVHLTSILPDQPEIRAGLTHLLHDGLHHPSATDFLPGQGLQIVVLQPSHHGLARQVRQLDETVQDQDRAHHGCQFLAEIG